MNSSIGSAGQGAPHLIFSSQLPGQWGSSGLPQSRSSQQACGGRPKMDHDRSRVGSFGFSDSEEKGYVTLEGNGAAGAVGDGRIMRVGPAAPPAVNAHALAFRSGVAPLERGHVKIDVATASQAKDEGKEKDGVHPGGYATAEWCSCATQCTMK